MYTLASTMDWKYLAYFDLKKVHIAAKIGNFLSFKFIKFLGEPIQIKEIVIFIFSIKSSKQVSKVGYFQRFSEIFSTDLTVQSTQKYNIHLKCLYYCRYMTLRKLSLTVHTVTVTTICHAASAYFILSSRVAYSVDTVTVFGSFCPKNI